MSILLRVELLNGTQLHGITLRDNEMTRFMGIVFYWKANNFLAVHLNYVIQNQDNDGLKRKMRLILFFDGIREKNISFLCFLIEHVLHILFGK